PLNSGHGQFPPADSPRRFPPPIPPRPNSPPTDSPPADSPPTRDEGASEETSEDEEDSLNVEKLPEREELSRSIADYLFF
ncbi:unnamed protein product, partial [Cyprideis torosa]